MVAIPIAYDQPGVAARIEHHGVGKSLKVDTLSGKRLLDAIREVLDNPSYRDRARYFQKVIGETRGLEVAADRIEQAFQTNPSTRVEGVRPAATTGTFGTEGPTKAILEPGKYLR